MKPQFCMHLVGFFRKIFILIWTRLLIHNPGTMRCVTVTVTSTFSNHMKRDVHTLFEFTQILRHFLTADVYQVLSAC